ncbi:MAG: anaerobic ribonucleoside triphosphate reductase [Clostridiales Family XIII bacterium]|jgi:ribonucleoside-triphosphate reductase|nr:anaerobic ribonucleoside triphosphate reductase [Clostridiales Family XIII bacterium]
MFTSIKKRDGRTSTYNISKIESAISKAMIANNRPDTNVSAKLAKLAEDQLFAQFGNASPEVEAIQDVVEDVLMENGYPNVAKGYILYRAERSKVREMNTNLMKTLDELTFAAAGDSNMKRDNANIDGDTAMGVMLKYGSESAKDYYAKYILTPEQHKAHSEGDIHIHDFDFYTLTTTCCQIDIKRLFENGFSTGHGHLREPNSIHSYAALACIAIQSNQNDQHGGQSIPNFDYGLALGVKKTFRKIYISNFAKALNLLVNEDTTRDDVKARINSVKDNYNKIPELNMDEEYLAAERVAFADLIKDDEMYDRVQSFAYTHAEQETEKEVHQAMEAVVHNLNTMHSRAGAQTPFSSINYGTDTSPEGRMIIRNVLLATEAGLGGGETPIFPIHIFKVKEGINYNEEDPNYDLFKLACRVSAKRLFPNFSFLDAPFNLAYYQEGKPETEVGYMGCRTRVLGNTYDPDNEIAFGRGNLSFTSINLPRIAIKSHGDVTFFFEELERKMDLCAQQLLDRYAIQAKKRVRNFPFLMGQGVWIGSEGMHADDEIGEILKHGTLSIGFIGLAEALKSLMGAHHGESEAARNMGLEIVGFMRTYLDRKSQETHMNFSLLATPAEGLSGRFVRLDQKKFGTIEGVTDREYYTNGFHVPVYYNIGAFEKIEIEAPYHNLTNAGHISYVELDGDASSNIDAFESIVRCMKEAGIGYGSINHPVDRDPICGYNGIIDDVCPGCGRHEEDGPYGFERIRRITGYLVGTLDRFNDAKKAEVADRVKHNVASLPGEELERTEVANVAHIASEEKAV